MPALLDKMLAVARRDLLTALRYRSGFVLTILGSVVQLAAFYYLSRSIGLNFHPDGMDYFSFVLAGTGLYTFLIMSVQVFVSVVQEAQQTGTLEVLMTTATAPSLLVTLSAISASGRNALQLLFYLTTGVLLFGVRLRANLAACLLLLLLSFSIAAAVGLMAAAVQLTIHKGSAVVWLLGSLSWLLTGALFPVANLPQALQAPARFLPITHCITGLRLALFEGAGLASLGREFGVLALSLLILLPLGLLMFNQALRQSRISGTLSFY